MLTVANVRSGYGRVEILHDVSFAAPSGSVTALLGANGAGKTTLLRTVAGLLPVMSGTITFSGHAIADAPSHERVEAGLVLSPEGRLVFPTMTVTENLRLGAIAPRARAQAAERMKEMFELFPILEQRKLQAAATLSGGEQQMLAIARALMARPTLMLLDEPTLGLAPIMVKDIFKRLEGLRRSGLTIVLAEQDVRRALALADEAYVIESGRVLLSGPASALRDDPRVKAAYLGVH